MRYQISGKQIDVGAALQTHVKDCLGAAVEKDPNLEISVDLNASEIRYGSDNVSCEIPESVRNSLTTGQWDFLAQLLEAEDQIRATADRLPYMSNFS